VTILGCRPMSPASLPASAHLNTPADSSPPLVDESWQPLVRRSLADRVIALPPTTCSQFESLSSTGYSRCQPLLPAPLMVVATLTVSQVSEKVSANTLENMVVGRQRTRSPSFPHGDYGPLHRSASW
jgi:hypothetical protein